MLFRLATCAVLLALIAPASAASHTVSDARGDQLLLDPGYDILTADAGVRRGVLTVSVTMAGAISAAPGRSISVLAIIPSCAKGQLALHYLTMIDNGVVGLSGATYLDCGDRHLELHATPVVSGRTLTWQAPFRQVASQLPRGSYLTGLRVYSDQGDPLTSGAGTRTTHPSPMPAGVPTIAIDQASSGGRVDLS